ncbi:MAG: binding-protein-dependent transport system inner rane component [Vampirovibrio sp.]|jgi:oligopeptide transport system permease protein|nr:binding-protein-dependent transport system inner rane component [Vampirovibrio sp.]
MSVVVVAENVTAGSVPRKKHAFWRTPKVFWSAIFLAVILLLALFGPILGPDPNAINPEIPTASPWPLAGYVAGHWFGTDDLGRDLLSRVAVGARISLLIGFATAVVAVIIGTLYGTLSALFEGKVDTLMMRLIDIIYSLPGLMIVILFSVFMGRGIPSLVLALALFSWPDTARIIRGQILSLKREEFIEAFYSLGGRMGRLIWKHFIPNTAGLIILTATITVPRAILTESTLSFIGLGVEPPLSSWGTLASEGWQLVRVAPHMLFFPAILIFFTMIVLNLLGDGIRELFDPKKHH